MKRINKTDKKVLGEKKSTLTWFLYFDSGAKATASLMQRVVHFASYFLKLEFLIAICLSHLTLLSSGQGSNPGKPDFFRLSFRNCISCVKNCEDLLYIYLKTFMLGVSDRFLARYT